MEYLFLFVLPVIGAAAGAYFGAYWKKKGENAATHEDIDKLVDQVAAVTEATKEIEARISKDLWELQKHWEMKRDVVLEVMKLLADLEYSISTMLLTFTGQPVSKDIETYAIQTWNDALIKFKRARLLAMLVFGTQTEHNFDDLEAFAIGMLKGVKARAEIPGWHPIFRTKVNALTDVLHRCIMTQSSESSAAQAPAGSVRE
jgi:hypothetical protein